MVEIIDVWKEIVCPKCKGRKEIENHYYFNDEIETTGSSIKYMACPVCRGYGKIKICEKKFVGKKSENKFKLLDL